MAGNSRKNELKALFGGTVPAAAAPEIKSAPTVAAAPSAVSPAADATPPRAASGAVKAMGLTLGAMSREADEARALRLALEAGDHVLSLDPALVSSSFVEDRLLLDAQDDDDFLTLMESIRENGQQSPILVRPHPDDPGRYQTAYGHRRLKAALRLGQPVRAVVRPLTDDELVLAQGKENAERRNLSFIERALFAQALVERGFDRKVVGDALAILKSELSRLLQVVDSVPERFIRAIGPAPKAGRPRWLLLGSMLASPANLEKAVDEIYSERFRAAGSDQRFQMVFNRLSRSAKPEPRKAEELTDADGRVFARFRRDGRSARIEFSEDADPGFLDSLAGLLARHHRDFHAARDE